MDAAYCYLLRIIDDIWYDPAVAASPELRHWLVRAMHPLMMDVFPPLAGLLTACPWEHSAAGEGPPVAAPTFAFYPPGGAPLSRAGLQAAVLAELDAARATREGTGAPQVSSTMPCTPSAVRATALMVSCGGRCFWFCDANPESETIGPPRITRSAAIVC